MKKPILNIGDRICTYDLSSGTIEGIEDEHNYYLVHWDINSHGSIHFRATLFAITDFPDILIATEKNANLAINRFISLCSKVNSETYTEELRREIHKLDKAVTEVNLHLLRVKSAYEKLLMK